jgi:prepilin-type processing-associated H-X9-DG protein
MKKQFFTLVELVLVAGCAVIIVALTTAFADDLTEDPKIAACADVMRGIEQKLTAWENDHDGRIIFAHVKGVAWGRQLVNGGYFDKTGFYGTIKSYPRNFECPAETRQRNNGKVDIDHPSVNIAQSYDYGLNFHTHFKPTDKQPQALKRSKLLNPSRQMRMSEGEKYALTIVPNAKTDRHGEGAGNVLYADGHIAFDDMIPYHGARTYDRIFWFNE